MVRSAGAAAQVMAKEGHYVLFACPAVKCEWFTTLAGQRWAKWATPSTRTKRSVRPERTVALAGSLTFVASSSPPETTHMVVVRRNRRLARKKGPVDRWGNKALGTKTRVNKRTNKYIVRRRSG